MALTVPLPVTSALVICWAVNVIRDTAYLAAIEASVAEMVPLPETSPERMEAVPYS